MRNSKIENRNPKSVDCQVAASRPKALAMVFLLLAAVGTARADSARETLRRGNQLFSDSKYNEAIGKYDEALVAQPEVLEPKFNKADSYYRLDDLDQAVDLYKNVAAQSKDMTLVAKAKYNLGNCLFQQGTKQRDSDLQKAVDDMKSSITYWRQVLDIDPKNEKAARNIEVARLTIKDILDQLKKQQEQQKQQQGQQKQQQQQQQQDQQDQPQPQDPNQTQEASQSQDPNETKNQQQQQQSQEQQAQDQQQQQKKMQEQQVVPDTTAQEILDREQQQKKERQIGQRAQYRQVDKDW
jgi:Ca-activated chloride channel family protein